MSAPSDPLVVSVLNVKGRGKGLATVELRMPDGRRVNLVVPTSILTVPHVRMAAHAVMAIYSLSDRPLPGG